MLPFVIVALLVGVGMVLYYLLSGNAARVRAEERRRTYSIHESEERVPFAAPATPQLMPVVQDDALVPPRPGTPASETGTRIFEDSLATVRVEGITLGEEPSLDIAPPVEGRMVL